MLALMFCDDPKGAYNRVASGRPLVQIRLGAPALSRTGGWRSAIYRGTDSPIVSNTPPSTAETILTENGARAAMSDDQLMRLLRGFVLLLFISTGLLAASRYQSSVAVWVRRAAVVLFAIAAAYAVLLVVLWML